ncbi:MAG: flotillin-like protein FloA [Planctomycetaceae bacterium]|nr:flotillin-like protein FloA [Planctomycetaceae bacterium]
MSNFLNEIPSSIMGLIALVVVVLVLAVFFIVFSFGRTWLQARASGVPIGFIDLVGMFIRKVNSAMIVSAMITTHKAGLRISRDFLEAHYLAKGNVPVLSQALIMAHQAGIAIEPQSLAAHLLAGGNVLDVVRGLISASRANIPLPFDKACAIDLAGRDIVKAVNTSVDPRVIDCPSPTIGQATNKVTLDAVAQDGIQLKVKARVTVRTNIERLVGGATDETIIARVGEGIVSAIGSSIDYKQVLENPDRISKAVLAKGLDAGTAFDILSIDIADVDVGENVGAKLEIDRAQAKKQVAQADAEKRAAEARASQAEQEARIFEMRAKVVEAESQIPLAISEAFRSGNLGIMDYYRMNNIKADTDMRSAIGGTGSESNSPKS